MTDIVDRFLGAREALPSELSAASGEDDDLRRVLWVLRTAAEDFGEEWLTAAEIADVLRDVYKVPVPRQRVPGLLAGGELAAKKRIRGKFHYQLMLAGVSLLEAKGSAVTFVDPTNALSQIRGLEGVLSELTGSVRVCDPYVDGKTLDFLAECMSAEGIQLLTHQVNRREKFRRDLDAFRRQYSLAIEVRVADAGVLHDRYIIDGSSMLLIGTSLNSFARKQSFVVRVGEDVRRLVEKEFRSLWAKATVLV